MNHTPDVGARAISDNNGTDSLRDRVRSLRLPESRRANGAGGSSKLAWTLCLVFALSTGGLAYRLQTVSSSTSASAETLAADGTSGNARSENSVTTTTAASGNVSLEAKGYIIPTRQILVSPKVSGMIMSLFVEEGRRVKKGDVLAQLEKVDYQSDHDRATAQLANARHRLAELENGNRPEEIEQAKSELAESEANLEQLKAEFQRTRELRQRGALADRDYEIADTGYRAMARRVERLRTNHGLMILGPRVERIAAARAEVQLMEAELAKARWRLDNCTIRAPVTGTILKKNAEEGNIVNPIAFNGSFSLCDLADLSDLEVDLSVQERDIAQVFKGQPCEVRADAYPSRVYRGVVSRLMPIADRAKAAISVRVKLQVPRDEEGIYLKPEMGVVVSFLKTPKA